MISLLLPGVVALTASFCYCLHIRPNASPPPPPTTTPTIRSTSTVYCKFWPTAAVRFGAGYSSHRTGKRSNAENVLGVADLEVATPTPPRSPCTIHCTSGQTAEPSRPNPPDFYHLQQVKLTAAVRVTAGQSSCTRDGEAHILYSSQRLEFCLLTSGFHFITLASRRKKSAAQTTVRRERSTFKGHFFQVP